MAEHGFGRFSARQVARAIGYSIGTIYNFFPRLDHLLLAINTRTFQMWTEHLRTSLNQAKSDRIRSLVEAYFSFARENSNLWMAIYDHRLPIDVAMPAEDAEQRAMLTGLVAEEVAKAVGDRSLNEVQRLARSLIATVHGHCIFDLNGSFALMGETDPLEMAVERVRQSLIAERLQ